MCSTTSEIGRLGEVSCVGVKECCGGFLKKKGYLRSNGVVGDY